MNSIIEDLFKLKRRVNSLFHKVETIQEEGTLPSQTGNAGKVLISDGTAATWGTPTSTGGVRDPVPTDGSTNSVESNGVFDALALKVDKANNKQLSTEDYTTSEKTKLAAISGSNTGDQDLSSYASSASVTSGLAGKANTSHTHTASAITDFQTQVTANTDVSANSTARHTHSNKTLLDSYTQTEVNLADAVSKKHVHSNSSSLALVSGTNTGDQDLSSYATLTGSQTILNKSIATILNPASDQTTIECWGDSHTAGAGQTPFTTNLATLSGLVVNNNGVGGETSTQIKTRFDSATSAKKARPTIIWAGFNDYPDITTVRTNVDSMITALGHSSYLVIGDIMSNNGGFDIGAAGWLDKMTLNRYFATTYGQQYVDIHTFIMSLYNSADDTDLSDYLKDIEPNSTRIDAQHFTSAVNTLIGAELYRRLKDLGIGVIPLNRNEIAKITLSPANMGAVNKGTGKFSYVEVDKLNIRKDGGLYQEGLPVYKHFRRSNFLGNNTAPLVKTGATTSNLDINVIGDNNLALLTGNSINVLGTNTGNNLTTGSNYTLIGNAIDAPFATSTNGFNIHNILFGGALNGSGTTIPTIGRVGIKTTNLTSTFTLAGSFACPYVAKTAAYTLTENDYTVNCTTGTFTITLPTAVGCTGRVYVVKNTGTGIITIATTSSQTIDGATTQSLSTQYSSITVQSTGANWIII